MNSNSTELPVSDPEEQRTTVNQESLENPPTQQQTKEVTQPNKNTNTLWSKLEPVILTSLFCCGLTVCCIVGVPTLIVCSPVICVVGLIIAIYGTTYEFYNWLRDPNKWAL